MVNRFVDKLGSFADLSDVELRILLRLSASAAEFPPKHDLIREGDRPGPVFAVLEGWACRYKVLPNGSRQVTAFLMPGDTCDLHIGLLDAMDHSIQTITAARVATIGRAEMDAVMDDHRGIARAMYVSQLVDEGIMRAWITSMGRRSSIERVAHLMCELYLRGRSIGLAAEDHFALPLSQIMLADALGMTPVHMNRVLKDLRQSEVMDIRRGSLTVINPGKLVQIAGFDDNYLHRRLRAVGL